MSGPRGLGPAGWVCAAWLVLVSGAAVLAPWLPVDDPELTDFSVLQNNASPGTGGHLLGTDQNGFDILSRLVWGGRVSLVVAFGVLALGMTVGGTIGLIAGYARGRVEAVLMGAVDILLAFPALLLLIAIVAFVGADLENVVLGISLVSIPAFARIARATTLTFASRDFVLAARAAGATNRRIVLREILPNVFLPLLAFGLLIVAIAIVAEGSLAFLGLTSQDTISWGGMINGGRRALQQEDIAHTSLIPAFVMFFTVLSVNFLGDRFRAAFDVRDAAL
ncbi:MAG: ABC transporter permease [Acidimicrobiales bacterium]|nr:ABC transporter permease [Acidimicrobiales bacterium]